jgi:hypothetical protein
MESSQVNLPQPTHFYGESGSNFAVLDLNTGEQRIVTPSLIIRGFNSYTYALIQTGGLFGTVNQDAVHFESPQSKRASSASSLANI